MLDIFLRLTSDAQVAFLFPSSVPALPRGPCFLSLSCSITLIPTFPNALSLTPCFPDLDYMHRCRTSSIP